MDTGSQTGTRDWHGVGMMDLCTHCGFTLDGPLHADLPCSHRYDLDGEPCTYAEFYDANADTLEVDFIAVRNMAIGDTITYGGGAAALMVLTRVA